MRIYKYAEVPMAMTIPLAIKLLEGRSKVHKSE